jgi:hypothetical protein
MTFRSDASLYIASTTKNSEIGAGIVLPVFVYVVDVTGEPGLMLPAQFAITAARTDIGPHDMAMLEDVTTFVREWMTRLVHSDIAVWRDYPLLAACWKFFCSAVPY